MSDQKLELESMTCEELLRQLARLSTERDALHADLGAAQPSGQETRVEDMDRQAAQIKRIGELLTEKGCQGS